MTDCQCHQRGCIQLIIGPMFSGKTTELFRLVQRHILASRKVVVVKYSRDTRYDPAQATTHDRRKMEALSADKIEEVYDELDKCDVIGIDEGQFFNDIVLYSEKLANAGKTVIIAALNGDYKQESFQNVAALIPLAEKIEKLSAVCRCGQSASFTVRKSANTKVEVIGGAELYSAICRSCLNEEKRKKRVDLCQPSADPKPPNLPHGHLSSTTRFVHRTARLKIPAVVAAGLKRTQSSPIGRRKDDLLLSGPGTEKKMLMGNVG